MVSVAISFLTMQQTTVVLEFLGCRAELVPRLRSVCVCRLQFHHAALDLLNLHTLFQMNIKGCANFIDAINFHKRATVSDDHQRLCSVGCVIYIYSCYATQEQAFH